MRSRMASRFAFGDDHHSRASRAPVKNLHHPLGLELLDDAHLVVDERSELLWLGDRTSCNSDHVRLLWLFRFEMDFGSRSADSRRPAPSSAALLQSTGC